MLSVSISTFIPFYKIFTSTTNCEHCFISLQRNRQVNMFYIQNDYLNIHIFSGVVAYVQNHQIVHIKYVQFYECQLYLSKAVKNKLNIKLKAQ